MKSEHFFLFLFALFMGIILILDHFKIIKPTGPFCPPFTIERPK